MESIIGSTRHSALRIVESPSRRVSEMNTSAKGSAYENAFKHVLERKPDVKLVMRAAGSMGMFDLIAVDQFGAEGYQLKSGRLSCRAAAELTTANWMRLGMPQWFGVTTVHK